MTQTIDETALEELATRTETAKRYIREWCNAQAASGVLHYHSEAGTYEHPRRHAYLLHFAT